MMDEKYLRSRTAKVSACASRRKKSVCGVTPACVKNKHLTVGLLVRWCQIGKMEPAGEERNPNLNIRVNTDRENGMYEATYHSNAPN